MDYTSDVHIRAKLEAQQHCFFVFSVFAAAMDLRSIVMTDSSRRSGPESFHVLSNLVVSTIMGFFAVLKRKPGKLTERDDRITSHESKASWSEDISFSWINPLITLGYMRPLDDPDMWDIPPELRVNRAIHEFKKGRGPTMLKSLFYVYRVQLMKQAMYALISTGFTFAPPYFMNRILTKLQSGDTSMEARFDLYMDLAGFVLGGIFTSVFRQRSLWIGRQVGACIRAVLSSEIYEKSLRRRDTTGAVAVAVSENPDDKKKKVEDDAADVGKVTNLLNVDAPNVADIMSYVDYFYANPLQVVVALWMLWRLLGYSVIFGVISMIITNVAMTFIADWYKEIVQKVSDASDARMNLITEVNLIY